MLLCGVIGWREQENVLSAHCAGLRMADGLTTAQPPNSKIQWPVYAGRTLGPRRSR